MDSEANANLLAAAGDRPRPKRRWRGRDDARDATGRVSHGRAGARDGAVGIGRATAELQAAGRHRGWAPGVGGGGAAPEGPKGPETVEGDEADHPVTVARGGQSRVGD